MDDLGPPPSELGLGFDLSDLPDFDMPLDDGLAMDFDGADGMDFPQMDFTSEALDLGEFDLGPLPDFEAPPEAGDSEERDHEEDGAVGSSELQKEEGEAESSNLGSPPIVGEFSEDAVGKLPEMSVTIFDIPEATAIEEHGEATLTEPDKPANSFSFGDFEPQTYDQGEEKGGLPEHLQLPNRKVEKKLSSKKLDILQGMGVVLCTDDSDSGDESEDGSDESGDEEEAEEEEQGEEEKMNRKESEDKPDSPSNASAEQMPSLPARPATERPPLPEKRGVLLLRQTAVLSSNSKR